jgi:hypothetical protein
MAHVLASARPDFVRFRGRIVIRQRHLSRRLARRLVLPLVLCLVASLGFSACTPARPAGIRVEVWGDSIAYQAAPYINYFIDASGKAHARTHVFPATAICDAISDIRSELDPHNPNGYHPNRIVLVYSGVALYPCMKDANGVPLAGQALIDKYAADARTVIAIAAQVHVPVYFASTPIFKQDAARYVNDTPLGVMYSTLPAAFPGGMVRFIDAALSVEWHGHYTDTLPCLPFEHCTGRWPDGVPDVVVRESDGKHFCPVPEFFFNCPVPMPGAMRYGAAITSRVLADLHGL